MINIGEKFNSYFSFCNYNAFYGGLHVNYDFCCFCGIPRNGLPFILASVMSLCNLKHAGSDRQHVEFTVFHEVWTFYSFPLPKTVADTI